MMSLTTESLSADPWGDVVGTAPPAEGLQNQFRIVLGADGNLVALKCKKDDETGVSPIPGTRLSTEPVSADPWNGVAGRASPAEALQNEFRIIVGANGSMGVLACKKDGEEVMLADQSPAAPEGVGSLMLEQTVAPVIEA